jgi:hypothetical protein
VGPRDRCAAFRWQDDLISAVCSENGDGVDRLRTLYSVSFAVSVKGFAETGSSLDNGCGRSHLYGRGNTAPRHGRSSWPLQMGWALSPSGWHRLLIRTGYHRPRRGTLHESRLADRADSLESQLGARIVSVQLHAVVEREIDRFGYSYTLYERGAKSCWALGSPNYDTYPRFVRLSAHLTGGCLTK